MSVANVLVEVRIVRRDGSVGAPSTCSLAGGVSGPCKFFRNGAKRQKKPLLTATGPVFLLVPRYRCTVHNGEFAFKKHYEPLLREGESFLPDVIRIGKVRVGCVPL